MSVTKWTWIIVLSAVPAIAVWAASDGPVAGSDGPKLEWMKRLVGTWVRVGDDGTATDEVVSIYRETAAGSAIIETTGAGTPNEMATIFHMDGDQLLQTHYCALMNAPVLRFEQSDTPGELKFVFHGGTNFDAAVDAHYHEGTLQIKDKDTIETSFVVFANGEISTDGRSVLKRAKKHSN